MSKAFTKDDGGWDEPVVAPRAPLPDGVPNYVTPRGLRLLRSELHDLEAGAPGGDGPSGDEGEERRRRAILGQRMEQLGARIASARVVEPEHQPHDEVRFGATVTLRTLEGARAGDERRLTIVGVDEADPAEGRIAFTAPLARAVLGCSVGEIATLETAGGEELLEVLAIAYEP